MVNFRSRNISGRCPVLPLIYGNSSLTWLSALLFGAERQKIAIVGRFEEEAARNTGAFDVVLPYDQSVRPQLIKVIDDIAPNSIAINISKDDVLADGLTYGMYQILVEELLLGPPYADTGWFLPKKLSPRCGDEKRQSKLSV